MAFFAVIGLMTVTVLGGTALGIVWIYATRSKEPTMQEMLDELKRRLKPE